MSSIYLENVNLIFNVWREKRIRDIIIPGSKKFSDFENGSVHAIKDVTLSLKEGDRLAIIGYLSTYNWNIKSQWCSFKYV